MTRRHPNLNEKLASALLELLELRGTGIPFRQAQTMSAKDINAMVEWDHAVYATWNGSCHPTNLTPRLKADHRHKTATKDIPAIAKSKRIARKRKASIRAAQELARIDIRGDRSDGHKSRPMPCGRKSKYKRTLRGQTVLRCQD
jgi:hypothetical protein